MAEDIRNMDSTIGKKSFEVKFQKPDCIVLDSSYCSMGRMIGMKACELAGYRYFDAVSLLDLIPDCKYSKDDVDRIENTYRIREYTRKEMLGDDALKDMMDMFDATVKAALALGPCLIHDRTTKEFVEALGYSCVSVFTTTVNEDYQIERAQTSPMYKDIANRDALLQKIAEENMIRRNIQNYLSDQRYGEVNTYDLIINTDLIGRDYAAQLLAHVLKVD